MKPSLEDMHVFLTVVEARTFTAAAEQLRRTKSAVSQAISRLESDIGVHLLYRSTRSLSLTEAGTQFYGHCRDIRDVYDNALLEIKAKPSGTLSVTAPHAICKSVVDPAIAKFVEIYPDIDVRLLADDSPMDLIESQVDLAIRVGDLTLQSAKVSKLGMLYESLYACPEYIASQGGLPEELAVISNWSHIANDWQGVPVKYVLPKGDVLRVTPRVRCNSFYDMVRLAKLGAGVARLPDITVLPSVTEGSLIKMCKVSATPVYYMHLFSNKPPAKVKKFITLLRDGFKSENIADHWKR